MAMLRKSVHAWTIKQEIQKLTAIRSPSPRLHPIHESPGSPTHTSRRSSHSPIPSLLFYCQNLPPTPHFRLTQTTTCPPPNRSSETRPPSTAALDPKTTEEFARLDDKIIDLRGSPSIIALVTLPPWEEAKMHAKQYCKGEATQDDVDRFYQEMSKEVQTILCEQDQRTLPEEISRSRSVVVTCVFDGGECDAYVLRTKHRSQESCRELEVVSVAIYVQPQVVYMESPHPLNTHGWLNMERNRKVVNKLEVNPESEHDVAFQEAMKYGGKVIPDDSPIHVALLRKCARQLRQKRELIIALLFYARRSDDFYRPTIYDLIIVDSSLFVMVAGMVAGVAILI